MICLQICYLVPCMVNHLRTLIINKSKYVSLRWRRTTLQKNYCVGNHCSHYCLFGICKVQQIYGKTNLHISSAALIWFISKNVLSWTDNRPWWSWNPIFRNSFDMLNHSKYINPHLNGVLKAFIHHQHQYCKHNINDDRPAQTSHKIYRLETSSNILLYCNSNPLGEFRCIYFSINHEYKHRPIDEADVNN